MSVTFPSLGFDRLRRIGMRWPVALLGHGNVTAAISVGGAALSFAALIVIALSAYFAGVAPQAPVSAASWETLSVPTNAIWSSPIQTQSAARRR